MSHAFSSLQRRTTAAEAWSQEASFPANEAAAVAVTTASVAAAVHPSRSASSVDTPGEEVMQVASAGRGRWAASNGAGWTAAGRSAGICPSPFCTSLARRIDPPEEPAPGKPAERDLPGLQWLCLSTQAGQP